MVLFCPITIARSTPLTSHTSLLYTHTHTQNRPGVPCPQTLRAVPPRPFPHHHHHRSSRRRHTSSRESGGARGRGAVGSFGGWGGGGMGGASGGGAGDAGLCVAFAGARGRGGVSRRGWLVGWLFLCVQTKKRQQTDAPPPTAKYPTQHTPTQRPRPPPPPPTSSNLRRPTPPINLPPPLLHRPRPPPPAPEPPVIPIPNRPLPPAPRRQTRPHAPPALSGAGALLPSDGGWGAGDQVPGAGGGVGSAGRRERGGVERAFAAVGGRAGGGGWVWCVWCVSGV